MGRYRERRAGLHPRPSGHVSHAPAARGRWSLRSSHRWSRGSSTYWREPGRKQPTAHDRSSLRVGACTGKWISARKFSISAKTPMPMTTTSATPNVTRGNLSAGIWSCVQNFESRKDARVSPSVTREWGPPPPAKRTKFPGVRSRSHPSGASPLGDRGRQCARCVFQPSSAEISPTFR